MVPRASWGRQGTVARTTWILPTNPQGSIGDRQDFAQEWLVLARKMPIILARIDDRLIHGQITVSWSKTSNPDVIAVVSDKVASDDLQRSALGLGTPIGTELVIYTVKDATKELGSKSPSVKKRVFVIAPSPKEFLDLIKGGVKIESINVGQMGFKQGRKQISKTVSVGKDDIQAFKELHALAIKLEQRQLPSDKKVELEKLLPELL